MIYLGSDKHGYKTLETILSYLKSKNIAFENLGVKTSSEDIKLEDLIPKVTEKVLRGKENFGILICGTGVGVEVGANKFSGIRACLVSDEKVAQWSRKFDNCNVLCLSGWSVDDAKIPGILDAWLNTAYDGNTDRLKMIQTFDSWH